MYFSYKDVTRKTMAGNHTYFLPKVFGYFQARQLSVCKTKLQHRYMYEQHGCILGAQFNKKYQKSFSPVAARATSKSYFLLIMFVLPQCNESIHSLGHYELYCLIRLKYHKALFFMFKFIFTVIPTMLRDHAMNRTVLKCSQQTFPCYSREGTDNYFNCPQFALLSIIIVLSL